MLSKKLANSVAAAFAVALMAVPTAHADTTKTMALDNKGTFSELVTLPAGKEVEATTEGDKQTDVHLFIYDDANHELGKDVSPGPLCDVKFTPAKAGVYKFVVINEGPGANKVTLAVKVAK